ncbi:hypothetical protein MLD38_002899 [Melastoma candidum]|uniref:Uncharacterized protein n=1 Tax=Melastoma candidum TaxID=119954 RepID=A0ACB9S035_9MYRT|nr:hypothetical protein MLD38_002899 [Melastoma candidum]
MPATSLTRKCVVAAAAFIAKLIILALVCLFFAWISTPKAKLLRNSVAVNNFEIHPADPPSFSLELGVEVEIKNRNFGQFQFPKGELTVAYSGVPVGSVLTGKDRVKATSSKKIKAMIWVKYQAARDNPKANSRLKGEIGKGVIPLIFHGKFKGQVRGFFLFFKEGKTARLKCAMAIDIRTKAVRILNCHVKQI